MNEQDLNQDITDEKSSVNYDSSIATHLMVMGSLANYFPKDDKLPCSVDDSDGDSSLLPHAGVTRGATGIFKLDPKYALAISASKIPIPISAKFPITIPKWKEAMSLEFKAL